MENSVTANAVKHGQTLADRAADKVQGGIRDAQHAAKDAGGIVDRVQSMSRQGVDAISDMASQARDVASNTSDSVLAYTKKNPATALAIAAASGALLYVAIKALVPSRD
jgi:ElaB/YqjD/DUF883 family membrane-anchored ribosome-binding protein